MEHIPRAAAVTGRALRVVVSGSECTGKTTLAAHLAGQFGVPWSPEFARAYQERHPRLLTAADVEPIARGQAAGEDAASRAAVQLVVHDTDLISTVVYSRHYYGACPPWIEAASRSRQADLYLLLHPDVPWVGDGLQRDRPAERDALHALFSAELRVRGVRAVDVRGDWLDRDQVAVRAVEELLGMNTRRPK